VREFFVQNETIILFAQGLVFFSLGFAVWLQRSRATRLTSNQRDCIGKALQEAGALGLDVAGVAVDKRGFIEVDEALRTSNPAVWALGDCNGKGAFTHTAYNDYEIVADNLLSNADRKYTDRLPVYALFTDPPLGRVGMSESEILKSGLKALVGKRSMTRVGRAVEKGETQGFMKIAVDADTKEILGATILGVGGDEAIHCVLDLMYAKAPYTAMQRMVHIHPTVAELLPTLLGELVPLQ